MLLSDRQQERLTELPDSCSVVNVWMLDGLVIHHPRECRFVVLRRDGRLHRASTAAVEELERKRIDEVAPLV